MKFRKQKKNVENAPQNAGKFSISKISKGGMFPDLPSTSRLRHLIAPQFEIVDHIFKQLFI